MADSMGTMEKVIILAMGGAIIYLLATRKATCTNPSNKVITLYEGWNMISYFCDREIPIEEVFDDIWEDVIVISGWHNGENVSANPTVDQMFWTLRKMRPGYGYTIKMAKERQLDYDVVCTHG